METPVHATSESPVGRPDTALVAAIVEGSTGAEDELVRRFGPPLRLLLGRHTRNPEEAEDLFQETFRLALEKLRRGELREAEKLPGFLAALARNLAIEVYRKAGRRKTDADSDAVDHSISHRPDPLDDTLARENAVLVRRVLMELRNDRDRQVLYRFYLAEEDRETLAADLGLTPLQFNRVLHRARQRFKELAEQVWGPAAGTALALFALLPPSALLQALLPTLCLALLTLASTGVRGPAAVLDAAPAGTPELHRSTPAAIDRRSVPLTRWEP